ncbi:ammonium transporter [Dictyocaulus viviparus]|uniref:Ammonium transporter n=2 Tax=Strongyloidea TaxID=27829 RepID=A0A0D8Y3V1_DICVI|nr:ammonium transporter [Dictyocaulus viviparus]
MAQHTFNMSAMQIVQIHHYAAHFNSSEIDKLYQDDAVWIVTSSFIIFTMHSGFGLLESGSVSAKDEVNIMVKNVVDVVFGGISYWTVGYGLSYVVLYRDVSTVNEEGWAYAAFLFQLSLATTASTIVSGAVAERAKLKSYILLGCLVILIQALPAHWVWDSEGFFYKLGVIDFAGCSAVHMVGGIIGLIATVYLKPRRNRFNEDSVHQMSSPTNALLGTFLLWWGWFGINAGSVWGITNGRWRLGARAAVATIMSSIGGGATSIVISFVKTKKLQVNFLINGILSSIVSITALCALSRPWHALIIGGVSSMFSILVLPILERFKVDDPVGIVPIHLTSSIWGMTAVGIFCEKDRYLYGATNGHAGVLYSGNFTLLGVQLLCTLTILVYSASFGLLILVLINNSPLGLRVTDYEEQIGADVIEHGLAGTNVARYVIEKPLSTRFIFQNSFKYPLSHRALSEEFKNLYRRIGWKLCLILGKREYYSIDISRVKETFQTVTKAITKWKRLARAKSRSKRMEQARQMRLNEDQAFTSINASGNVSNGVSLTGNGVLYNRRVSRASGTPTPTHSKMQGVQQQLNRDIEQQPTQDYLISAQRSATSPRHTGSPSCQVIEESTEKLSKSENSNRPTESSQCEQGPSTLTMSSVDIAGSDDHPRAITQLTTRINQARHGIIGKFARSSPARTLTPPDDVSMGDDDDQSVISAPPFGKNNKIAPQ